MSEKENEKCILGYLNTVGHKVWNNQNQGTYDASKGFYRANNSPFRPKGVPDILGISKDGKFLAIEVKKYEIYMRIKRNLPKWLEKHDQGIKLSKQISHFLEQHFFIESIKSLGGVGFFASNIGHCQDKGL